jgi:hypothetical protein
LDKEIFIQNFKKLLVDLNSFTAASCLNELSTKYAFILQPSARTTSNHLTDIENGYLKTWNKLKDKQISFDEVVDLLYRDGKTTKWADCTVYYSSKELTIVHIFFSRQFRTDEEIYYLDMGTGPFKAMVSLPPDHLKIMQGDKFDVNWKKHLDDRQSKNILVLLKRWLNRD